MPEENQKRPAENLRCAKWIRLLGKNHSAPPPTLPSKNRKKIIFFLSKSTSISIRNAECSCGWRKQTVKHILLFCPELAKERRELIEQVGTSDYRQILTQKHGIRAAARWMIKIGRLDQFSLAQEQLARSKLPLGLDKETKNKKKGKEKRGSKKKA